MARGCIRSLSKLEAVWFCDCLMEVIGQRLEGPKGASVG